MLIENCNNGGHVPYVHPSSQPAPPTGQDCPFNMFRVGSDISPSPVSTLSNLMDTSKYLNLSRPGCFAYPDMLELGCPVLGSFASRPDPGHPEGRRSSCNATDGTSGDTASRLTLEQGKAQFAHTLNATAIAAPRVLMAILENHQREGDGYVVNLTPTLTLTLTLTQT